MFVKNFRGRTAEECIQQLKSEMGKDAVILQSRTIRPIFGRFGPAIHEIVAATGLNTLTAPAPAQEVVEPAPRLAVANGAAPGRSALSAAGPQPRLTLAEAAELAERGDYSRLVNAGVMTEQQTRTMNNAAGYGANAYAAPAPAPDARLQQLERQIAQLTQVIEQSRTPTVKPAAPAQTRSGFLRYGVAAEPIEGKAKHEAPAEKADPYQSLVDLMKRAQIAEGLIRHIRDELRPGQTLDDAKNQLQEVLTRRMLTSGVIMPKPGKMTLAALLGPTGVGKTTTIAKLAANLALNTGVSVGMVTLDTQRVAAIQQLQTYGDILNVPTKVAYDKAELERILVEYASQHVQVVLIDTPGRGPSETLSLAEMSTSLRSVIDLNSYVVVPATLSSSNFEHTIGRFMKLANPTAIIMTKMDETADTHCLGFLLNAQAKHQLPLAYVTMGSRVPDDLLVADAQVLVSKLMVTNILQN